MHGNIMKERQSKLPKVTEFVNYRDRIPEPICLNQRPYAFWELLAIISGVFHFKFHFMQCLRKEI